MLTKILTLLLMPACCIAQEASETQSGSVAFKIHNQVFVEGSSSPASTNLTLFQGNRVFDFRYLGSGDQLGEITIFDAQDRSFVLLDVTRKLRLKVDNLQLLRILKGMENELNESPKVAHLLFEDAVEQFDASKNSIAVTSSRITYNVVGKRPKQDQILAEYLRFLENYTLLSVTDPRRMPPFARIKLNRAIKKFGIMPESVALNILAPDESSVEFAATSKHIMKIGLSDQENGLFDLARRYWMEFRQVSLAEYRSIDVADREIQSNKK